MHTHIWDGLYEREKERRTEKKRAREMSVMIVSLLTEKDGRVMDI